MNIEILNIAQISEVGLHVELVQFLRENASFVDPNPIRDIENDFIISTDTIHESIKYLEGIGRIVQSIQARDLYRLTEHFNYIMIIS